tara:strand:- start:20745 stop:20930 length:186 start_codon:yes stop_codon:yes gene_type:complete
MKLKRTFALSSLILAMGFPAYAREAEANAENNNADVEKTLIVQCLINNFLQTKNPASGMLL